MREIEPDLIWPRLLGWPSDTPLVYLDLNQWIYLAQAQAHSPSAQGFVDALKYCKRLRRDGAAAFALSGSHYMELTKIRDPAQRSAIADVMEELAGFKTLLGRFGVMQLELEAALNRFVVAVPPLPAQHFVGYGAGHAFGAPDGTRYKGPGGEAGDQIRERMGVDRYAAFLSAANLMLERALLRGPSDAELPRLKDHGWNPEASMRVTGERAEQERAQHGRFGDDNGRWRRGRTRDAVAARELIIEFQNILQPALRIRHLTMERIGPTPQAAMAFVRSMPSTEVAISIKTAWHRNANKKWTPNDIHDIDAMALSVPYCDVVVTEKACHHVLTTAGLDRRMRTSILRRLGDLPAAIDRWEPKRKS
jgi:hypothetical protein